jgi:hypothetical protein
MNRPYRWAITGDCPYKNLDPGIQGVRPLFCCGVLPSVGCAKKASDPGQQEAGAGQIRCEG